MKSSRMSIGKRETEINARPHLLVQQATRNCDYWRNTFLPRQSNPSPSSQGFVAADACLPPLRNPKVSYQRGKWPGPSASPFRCEQIPPLSTISNRYRSSRIPQPRGFPNGLRHVPRSARPWRALPAIVPSILLPMVDPPSDTPRAPQGE